MQEGTPEDGRAAYLFMTAGSRAPEHVVPVGGTEDRAVPGAAEQAEVAGGGQRAARRRAHGGGGRGFGQGRGLAGEPGGEVREGRRRFHV
jgi:hypothetical protein